MNNKNNFLQALKAVLAFAVLAMAGVQAGAVVVYEDYDDRDDLLDSVGASVSGTLDLVNDINDASFTAAGYGPPGDGVWNDNLGFPLGTATSGQFLIWVQTGNDFSVVQTDIDGIGVAGGGFSFSFATGTLSGSVLGMVNASGQLDWEATLLLGSGALIDGVGLRVNTPDPVTGIAEPGMLALMGLGFLGLGLARRQRRI